MRSVSNAIRFLRNVRFWRSFGYTWSTSWKKAKNTL